MRGRPRELPTLDRREQTGFTLARRTKAPLDPSSGAFCWYQGTVVRIRRDANLHILEFQLDGVMGIMTVKARHLGEDVWWIDLVRVGNPRARGQGLGSRTLELGIRYLRRQGARRIGLEPHAVGKARFDLKPWYQRHGFEEEDEKGLWMSVKELDSSSTSMS